MILQGWVLIACRQWMVRFPASSILPTTRLRCQQARASVERAYVNITLKQREDTVSDFARQFIEQSRRYLSNDYLPKINDAVGRLSDDDMWWKPNPSSNSVGNLLLHLTGNLRQWIVSGVGGAADTRQRELEFAPDDRPDRAALLDKLSRVVAEADAVLGSLDPLTLSERRMIQGNELTVLEVIYHAVEHFSTHTGQIVYIAKFRTGTDLAFYEVKGGVARARWPGHEGNR